MASLTTVEDYLATLPEDRRSAVTQLRETIRAAAPEATETIAYNMPAFRSHGGQFLVSFAAFKAHYSLFPASERVVEGLGDELDAVPGGEGDDPVPGEQAPPTGAWCRRSSRSGWPRTRLMSVADRPWR